MAEKNQAYPLPLSTEIPRSDEESAMTASEQLQRKKKVKFYAYIAAFVVLQTIIILLFTIIIMNIKTPDVKIRSVTVQNLNIDNASYNMTLLAEVTIRNKNFGHYKYENSTASISYGDAIVGDSAILKGNANGRKTQIVNLMIEVSSNGVSDTSRVINDINSEILTFNCHTILRGNVHLLKVIKISKTSKMNCTIALNLNSETIEDLNC